MSVTDLLFGIVEGAKNLSQVLRDVLQFNMHILDYNVSFLELFGGVGAGVIITIILYSIIKN